MEPITIIMILLGVVLLIGSCFLPKDNGAETDYDELINRLAKREITEEETERIRQEVDRIISEKTEDVIIKTDDYLSQVANEKIMSVDEFSKQILERLDKNNADVMFLYNMVSDTKEELKEEITKANKAKESLHRAMEEKAMAAPVPEKKTVKVQPAAPIQRPVKKVVAKQENKETKSTDDIAALLAATVATEYSNTAEGDMPKEKILALYREGKSIRDISRELGMGQGEVKLVIDLYGL